MLKKLRNKKTAKKVWIILAIIIVPAFVLWGSGSLLRNKQDTAASVGRIFGRNISPLEYKDAMDAVMFAAIMQFGDKFSEAKKYLNLESQAWERLILLHEARKRNIRTSDKEVVDLIQQYPFFQRNGRFDDKVYAEVLRYVFMTKPRLFEEATRKSIILSKLFDQVTQDIKLTDREIKDEYIKTNEEISISYIVSQPADFTKAINTTEEILQDFFSKNSLDFKQPLSFNMEYLVLDSDDQVKKIFPRLRKGADFKKIAKDIGFDIKETGLFTQTDPIPGIGWSPEVFNLILKLKVGDFSMPIRMDKHSYILRLKERRTPYIPKFEEIKEKVKEKYIKYKSEEMAKDKIEECLKGLQALSQKSPKNIDFNKAAKGLGLRSDSTNLFKFGSYIEGIGASDNFWIAAKQLKEDEISGIIGAPSGFYIIKIKSRVPIDDKKFESEKQGFSNKLLTQRKQEFFAKLIEELKRKVQ